MISIQHFSSRASVLLVLLLCASASLRVSVAWVSSPSASNKGSSSSSSSSSSNSIKTAKFFKTTPTVLAEEAARAAAQAVASGTVVPSPPVAAPEAGTATASTTTSLSDIRQLPWMQEENGIDSDESRNVFLDHWNWQLSFFEEHLTNLRVRDFEEQHGDDETIRDLYYATKGVDGDSNAGCENTERVYTISLESDEYRDIRMTYMHCSDLQTFRCLSYPRNGDIPVMGMSMIRMRGGRNLAIMDYQPLPPSDETESKINDAYTAALLELRSEIPAMSAPITHRNFAKTEDREYFTEFPLLGRCNDPEATDAEKAAYRETVRDAQRKHVSRHTELTRRFGRPADPSKLSEEYVLERHSDFDTNVSVREPAGGVLRKVFGKEKGERIFHNVIFPLSKHGLYGESAAASS